MSLVALGFDEMEMHIDTALNTFDSVAYHTCTVDIFSNDPRRDRICCSQKLQFAEVK